MIKQRPRLRRRAARGPVRRAVGWSEVGGCRSHLGFRLDGAWPSRRHRHRGPHSAAPPSTSCLRQIITGPGVRTEVDTEYRGIPGHADLVLTDAKAVLATGRRPGWPTPAVAVQPGRAAAEAHPGPRLRGRAGRRREAAGGLHGRLLVASPSTARSPTGGRYEEPFDRSLADEGADRLEWVRARLAAQASRCRRTSRTPAAETGASSSRSAAARTTRTRPRRSPTPSCVAAVARYGEADAADQQLYKEKDRLAEMIRGLRGTAGGLARSRPAGPARPKAVLDEDAIRADYAARGAAGPR